jgi:hypothetical protein
MEEQLMNGEPLSDEHIHFFQQLMKIDFPELDGLQSVLLEKTQGFAPVQQDAIQIHHVGNHWVTSSSLGSKVTVYDSNFVGKALSKPLTHQLTCLYKLKIQNDKDEHNHSSNTLRVEVPYVQQQEGITDCGLFAIAYAYHSAKGNEVASLNFDQSQMRDHLVKCFKNKQLEDFPQRKKTRGTSRPHQPQLMKIKLSSMT